MSLRRLLVPASLAFVVFAVWKGLPELRESAGAIRTLDPGPFVLALLCSVGAVATLPHVYRASVAALGGHVRYAHAAQASMGAFTLSRVLPGGGAAGGVWAARRLTRLGVAAPVAATAVVLEGLLAMVTLGLVVVSLTAAAGLRGDIGVGYIVAAGVALVVFAVALLACRVLLTHDTTRARAFAFVDRVTGRRFDVEAWRRPVESMAGNVPGVRALAPILGWSAVNWLLDVAALWLAFRSLGQALPIGVLVLGFGVAHLLVAAPHTPGGLGVVEVGMAGTYIGFGVPAPVAIVGVLVYRLLAYWLPVGAGVPQYLRAGRLEGAAERDAVPAVAMTGEAREVAVP